jgi:hypothetical protein
LSRYPTPADLRKELGGIAVSTYWKKIRTPRPGFSRNNMMALSLDRVAQLVRNSGHLPGPGHDRPRAWSRLGRSHRPRVRMISCLGPPPSLKRSTELAGHIGVRSRGLVRGRTSPARCAAVSPGRFRSALSECRGGTRVDRDRDHSGPSRARHCPGDHGAALPPGRRSPAVLSPF